MGQSAFEIAERYVEKQLQLCKEKGITVLPSMRAMARQANVSLMTIKKVVDHFQQKSVLETRPGSGIFIKGATLDENTVITSGTSWHTVEKKIVSDLHMMIYGISGELPSIKELCAKYETSFQTLRKALHSLEQKKIVYRSGKTYTSTPGSNFKRSKVLVLICRDFGSGVLSANWSADKLNNIRIIETICSHRGIVLSIVGISYQGKRLNFPEEYGKLVIEGARNDAVLGYIFIPTSFNNNDVAPILVDLQRSAKPVSVFNVSENSFCKEMPRRNFKYTKIFKSHDSFRAGKDVARFALELGHKKILYISPEAQTEWSKKRCEAIQSVYNKNGLSDGVKVITCTTLINYEKNELRAKLLSAAQESVKGFMKSQATLSYMQKLSMFLESDLLAKHIQMHENVRGLCEIATKEYPDIGLWICASDDTAIHCLDWLSDNNIDVPHSVSVIGFDDKPVSLYRKITTYNFNDPALLNLMVGHILKWPLVDGPGTPENPVIVDGFVVKRNTHRYYDM